MIDLLVTMWLWIVYGAIALALYADARALSR